MDGKPVEGGTLRGAEGETKTVRVEAEGYEPVVQNVALDRSGLPRLIPLIARAPEVAPSASPAPEPATSAKAEKKPATSTKPATPPKPTGAPPTPTAKPTGIAGGLQLKEN